MTPLVFSPGRAEVTVSGRVLLRDWGVAEHLRECLTPGVRVGRLVACDSRQRLSRDEIVAELRARELLLPDTLELREDGTVAFRGRPTKYSKPSSSATTMSPDQTAVSADRHS